MEIITVRASQTINGRTFEVSVNIQTSATLGITQATVRGMSELNAALNEFVDMEAQTVKRAPNETGVQIGASSPYAIEELDTIFREVVNGQHRVKVATPRFAKWGVPVYPEVLEQLNRKPEDVPIEKTAMPAWKVKILMDGDKPKKVVQFIKIDDKS